ncbi:MAG TPA: response regulator transcription factor [Streptosporangiaceae bacterium]|nr:response regulator transcription factor [Streptosporangiaceae bacterium]
MDDEPEIRDFVIRALMADGYEVDSACDGPDALGHAAACGYALIILDLVMPGADGKDMLARLRHAQPGLAILVLSCLSDVATKVDCLDLGAQDYLIKPFALAELLARVRVQLREEQHQLHEVLRAGQLKLDLGRLQADSGVGPVPLTRLEVMLLRELMEHHGQSVPKDQLLATVWGIDFDPGSNVVDVCVRRLRSKLGFDLIETVRGAGYRLAS